MTTPPTQSALLRHSVLFLTVLAFVLSQGSPGSGQDVQKDIPEKERIREALRKLPQNADSREQLKKRAAELLARQQQQEAEAANEDEKPAESPGETANNAPNEPTEPDGEWVAPVFESVRDACGHEWRFQPDGSVSSEAEGWLREALSLSIDAEEIKPDEAKMTPAGDRFLFVARRGRLRIARELSLDVERSVLHAVERFETDAESAVEIEVVFTTRLSQRCREVRSNLGRASPDVLEPNERGAMILPGGDVPAVLFILAEAESPNRPKITTTGDGKEVRVAYRITVESGQTAALVHTIARRSTPGHGLVAGATDASTDAGDRKRHERLFRPLRAAHTLRVLQEQVGSKVLNAGWNGFTALDVLDKLCARLEVERGELDILHVDDEGKLEGTVSLDSLSVATQFGRLELSLEEVAAIAGGAGVDRPMRCYLRTGEIVTGPIEAEALRFVTPTGLELDLSPERVDHLVLRSSDTDGLLPEPANALLKTHHGDRLAVTLRTGVLDVATPWGPLEIPCQELASLAYEREPVVAFRLELTDRSRLGVAPKTATMALDSFQFGPIELSTTAVSALERRNWRQNVAGGSGATSDATPPEERRTHCDLLGGNRIFGTLDIDELAVITRAGPTRVALEQVRSIARPKRAPDVSTFEITLVDGNQLTGRLERRSLPLRWRGRIVKVPVQHLLSYFVPKPEEDSDSDGPKKESV